MSEKLQKWYEALDKYKAEALEKLRDVCKDEDTLKAAEEGIEINYHAARMKLIDMDKKGFGLNDDLSAIREQYESNHDYSKIENHLSNHLWRMRNLPEKVGSRKLQPHEVHLITHGFYY